MKEWLKLTHRLTVSVVPYRSKVLLILLLALLSASIGVLEPLVLKYFVDETIAVEGNIAGIIFITISAFLVLSLAKETVGGVQNWLSWKIRLKLQVDLQAAAVEKLISLPVSYHQKEGVGGTITKFDRAIISFVNALCEIAFFIIPTFVFLIASTIVMFQLNWQLSLVVLFFVPVPALIGMWASKEQTEREKFLMGLWTRVYGRLNEAIACILIVKSFAMERAEAKLFLKGVTDTNSYVLKGVATDSRVEAFKNVSVTLARVAAIATGGTLIMQHNITIGTLIAFLGYINNLFQPVQGLTRVYQTYRKASVSLDILSSIMEAEDPVADVPSAIEVKAMVGEVCFYNVSFGYCHKRPIIKNLNLQVQAGEKVAIVGPSGAGKSTLMSLIMRLVNPSEGVVSIDGIDVRLLQRNSIKRHIGVVLQECILFNETIRNNINYGSEPASQIEIEFAARLANAHDFIMQLPEGYDTKVGERGNNLSGGQKQRIAIARAILKNPAILILDEATSALDAETDALVQEAFKRLVTGRTTFIISHKLANIVGADKILVLRNGQINQIIKPEELQLEERFYSIT